MLKQVNLYDAVGKTIKVAHQSDMEVILVFEDGTFSALHNPFKEIEDDWVSLNADRWHPSCWPAKLIEMGIYTKDEFNAANAAHALFRQNQVQQQKQKQFEELKAELFGPNNEELTS